MSLYAVQVFRRKRLWHYSLIFLVLLVIIYLASPYILKAYLIDTIDSMPGYHGEISQLHTTLFRGELTVEDVKITHDGAQQPTAFFSARQITLQLEPKYLLRGRLIAIVSFASPTLQYSEPSAKAPTDSTKDAKPEQTWQTMMQQLFLFRINDIAVNDGKIIYVDPNAEPPFNITLSQISLTADNLQVLIANGALPADISFAGKLFKQANLSVRIHFDPRAKTPTFHLSGALPDLDLTRANTFLEAYTDLKAEQGRFSLYIEASASDNRISGYIKPLIKDLTVKVAPQKAGNPLKHIYRVTVQLAHEVFKNTDTQQTATLIPISGRIDKPDTSTASIIANLLQNAFLQAILPGLEYHTRDNIDLNAK